jgi:hypothetical protein
MLRQSNYREMNNQVSLFIFVLFISLSVYNNTNFLIRVTDFFVIFLLVFIFKYLKEHALEILLLLIFCLYLLSVEIVNNNFSNFGEALSRLRYWIYIYIYIILAKIFLSIDVSIYSKKIRNAMIMSISIIFIIYFLVYLDVSFIIYFFTDSRINEDLLYLSKERLGGVSVYIFYFFIILNYNIWKSKKVNYLLFISIILITYLTLTRQFFVTSLIIFAILYISKRTFYYLISILIGSYFLIISFIQILLKDHSNLTFVTRLAEIVYITQSPSILGRFRDLSYFINNWTENIYNFIVGHGLSFSLVYPRFYQEFNPLLGKLNVFYSQAYLQNRHNADNLISLLIVEGGLLLLIFISVVFLITLFNIIKINTRMGILYLFIFIVTSITSVHVVTNYIIVFTLAYIYYYTINSNNKGEK